MNLAHDDSGRPVPFTDFDYESVNVTFGDPEVDLSTFSQEEVDRGLAVLDVLLKWVWQSGMKNAEGIQIRAMVICWVFLKQLRPLSETQLANGFGKDKQSLGRWVADFKAKFPRIGTAHMRYW